MKKLLMLAALLMLVGCTENQRAQHFGGTVNVNLPKGQRLINVTWKGKEGGNIWYLTEPMGDASPRTLTFSEDSSFGLLNGKIILIESK